MKTIFKIPLSFVALFILVSCNSRTDSSHNEENHDTLFSEMPLTKPIPFPTATKTDTIQPDPLDLIVSLISDSIEVTFSNKTVKLGTSKELDTFIKENNIATVSPRVILKSPKETPSKRGKEVMQILNDNHINKFSLVTELKKR